jgi:hypothetical protein
MVNYEVMVFKMIALYPQFSTSELDSHHCDTNTKAQLQLITFLSTANPFMSVSTRAFLILRSSLELSSTRS